MAKKFNKGDLVKQGLHFGIVKTELDEGVEVEDAHGNPWIFYYPTKIIKEEIKDRISSIKKEIKLLEAFL